MSSDEQMSEQDELQERLNAKITEIVDDPGSYTDWEYELACEVTDLRTELAASDRLGEYVAGSASRTLDLVGELQAENAALREFVQIVADNSYASERDLVESARALLGGVE